MSPQRASVRPPQPTGAAARRLGRVLKAVKSRVDTLVGFEVDPHRIGLPSKRALSGTGLMDLGRIGPNPFGPATAEFDIAPFLRTSLSIGRESTAIAVVLVCLLAGVATALSMFSDDTAGKRETLKSPSSLATPPTAGIDLPTASAGLLEPRLADLYDTPETSALEPSTSEMGTREADVAPAPSRARRRRARARRRVRRRRAARRRARARARR